MQTNYWESSQRVQLAGVQTEDGINDFINVAIKHSKDS